MHRKPYLCTMFKPLFSLAFLAGASVAAASPLPQDSLQADTLKEVIVHPRDKLPVEEAIDQSLRRGQIGTKTLGDILERLSPGINDKITHPFAIKARQKERRRKRAMKALENFDRVRTFDELLREAYEQMQLEDSLKTE